MRFHNLVAALTVAKPVVSLGYAGKNARLLADFGVARLDKSIDAFDVDTLLVHLAEAGSHQATARARMVATRDRYAAELSEQLARVSAQVLARSAG